MPPILCHWERHDFPHFAQSTFKFNVPSVPSIDHQNRPTSSPPEAWSGLRDSSSKKSQPLEGISALGTAPGVRALVRWVLSTEKKAVVPTLSGMMDYSHGFYVLVIYKTLSSMGPWGSKTTPQPLIYLGEKSTILLPI
ncbi:hypothetical protein Bbelb_105520 [Branchiostoma belcheri]|nr:hypothetical protein Bbelb_105520 [Branchiostoma belcheri]